jgi:general secretion pathway protein M
MQELQAQAKNLQMTQALSRADALVWLEKNLTELGPEARIKLQDERATLSVSAAEPEALARWLSDARERAQALPVQGQLKQTSTPVVALAGKGKIGSPTMPSGADESVSSGARAPILWQGTLVLRLP